MVRAVLEEKGFHSVRAEEIAALRARFRRARPHAPARPRLCRRAPRLASTAAPRPSTVARWRRARFHPRPRALTPRRPCCRSSWSTTTDTICAYWRARFSLAEIPPDSRRPDRQRRSRSRRHPRSRAGQRRRRLARAHARIRATSLSTERFSPAERMRLEIPYSKELVEAFWLAAGGSILAGRCALQRRLRREHRRRIPPRLSRSRRRLLHDSRRGRGHSPHASRWRCRARARGRYRRAPGQRDGRDLRDRLQRVHLSMHQDRNYPDAQAAIRHRRQPGRRHRRRRISRTCSGKPWLKPSPDSNRTCSSTWAVPILTAKTN